MKKTFDIANIFSFSWQIFKKNSLLLIGLTFLSLAVPSLLSFLASQIDPSSQGLLSLFYFILTLLISIVVFTISLRLAQNKPCSLNDFSFKQTVSFFITYALFYFIVMIGLILFIFPGIIWGLQFLLNPYFIIDKKMSPLDALKASKDAVYGYKWKLLGFILLALLLNLAGLLVLGLGIFITIPITWIGMARIYILLQETHD